MKAALKYFSYTLISFLILIGNLSFVNLDHSVNNTDTENKKNIAPKFFHRENISDGPYIFYENDKVVVKWIYKEKAVEKTIGGNNFGVIRRKFGFKFDSQWIELNKAKISDFSQQYSDVEKLVAVSDIHGQFDLLVKLLLEHNVIDQQYNWIFGNGHLVVLGDIMDRGDKVTEALWFIYRLEQQAEKVGGKVHVLLGNHELMVLNNDIRYIHEKYVTSSQLMNTTYNRLFSDNTFLGNWLRKKPVMVKINDMLFVHAGISVEFINGEYSASQTNQLFAEKITGKSWDSILNDSILSFMMDSKGPVWYRGYFRPPMIKEYQVDHLLKYFQVNHIIVVHTSLPNIVSLFHGKIFGIDSSIKYGDYGEILIYSKNRYYRGTVNGSLIDLY